MHKLDTILLVDDDDATNYLHEIHINNLKIAKHIVRAQNGKEALDILFSGEISVPDIIILDINMPVMSGWVFLEEYSKLRGPNISKIVMATASINPIDETHGKNHPYIFGFMGKPINEEKLIKILKMMDNRFFKD